MLAIEANRIQHDIELLAVANYPSFIQGSACVQTAQDTVCRASPSSLLLLHLSIVLLFSQLSRVSSDLDLAAMPCLNHFENDCEKFLPDATKLRDRQKQIKLVVEVWNFVLILLYFSLLLSWWIFLYRPPLRSCACIVFSPSAFLAFLLDAVLIRLPHGVLPYVSTSSSLSSCILHPFNLLCLVHLLLPCRQTSRPLFAFFLLVLSASFIPPFFCACLASSIPSFLPFFLPSSLPPFPRVPLSFAASAFSVIALRDSFPLCFLCSFLPL